MGEADKQIWHTHETPGVPMEIEGTQVPLETDREIVPVRRKPKTSPQTEQIFPTPVSEPKAKTTRPIHGRLAMSADVNAAKREVENDLASSPLPEHPVGFEEAQRLLGEGAIAMPEDDDAEPSETDLKGQSVDLELRRQMIEYTKGLGKQEGRTAAGPKTMSEDDLIELLRSPASPDTE